MLNHSTVVDTLQAIIFGIFHGFASILPISPSAHHYAISFLYDMPMPPEVLLGAMNLGTLLALLIYFRYDWASMLASLLQVLLYWKKPMTLDERMPFFILISFIPLIAVWTQLQSSLAEITMHPLGLAGILAGFSLPLWYADRMNRQQKTILNWNWSESLIAGLSQCLYFLPGAGRQMGVLTTAFIRNFRREAAIKFSLYTLLPTQIFFSTWQLRELDWSASSPNPDLSWLSFSLAGILSFVCSLLAIGGLMKVLTQGGVHGVIRYRLLLALGLTVIYFIRNS